LEPTASGERASITATNNELGSARRAHKHPRRMRIITISIGLGSVGRAARATG
jgi:hypothetical protein